MLKSQLIDRVAEKTGVSRRQAAKITDALFDEMIEAFTAGEPVTISGFGNFTVKEVAAHKARNPRTNERVIAPATRRVTFIAGVTLKGKINHET